MHYFKLVGKPTYENCKYLWENREALEKYLKRLKELMEEDVTLKPMNKIFELQPVFVETIDKNLESGKLYISEKFNTAIHLCACGCGVQTVTPTGGDRWTLTNNGGLITLRPSIGNFKGENPYHAHYYVTDNKIEWL